jgi:tetratricopeptide (TPR) repeat protein
VSLLLDALKRAEQEKLARGDRPDLQIVGPAEGPHSARHDRAEAARAELELHPLTAPPAAPAAAAAGAATREKTAAQAAQAVFQAKVEPGRDKPRRTLIVAALAVIILAILGAGGYVWYAMKSLTPQPPAPRPAPMPITAASPATPAPAVSVVATPAPEPMPAPPPRAAAPAAPPDRDQIAADALREAQAAREAPPLRMDRTQESASVPADVSAGYDALRRGDYAGARRSYQAALGADGASLDAHLGLATAEARAGNISAASLFYRKALQLDPRNATALAGLAALADASRPGAVEARLREDVMRTPQSPALRLALGNVYAAQKRWSEAQGEYFEAHRLDPASPDIAFNLAVSLDNLGQAALAAQFYRRALDSARAQPAQFDPAAVSRRLAEMGS